MTGYPVLSTLIFAPVVGAVALLFMPRANVRETRLAALSVSFLVFLLSIPLWTEFREGTAALQFVENRAWVPALGITWSLGLDGLSMPLALLTTFLTPICILASWSIQDRVKEYMAAFLLLEAAMLGTFAAQDLLLFYVCWEAMLIPMFLIIGVWGGRRRIYAALKFFIFTVVGSLPMFIAILYLYFQSGATSFDLASIREALRASPLALDVSRVCFVAFAVAFAVKVPVWPLHTWLPDAHVEAPTAGSVILAGVLLKMGTYGLLRFAIPLFPEAAAHYAPVMIALAVIGIIYGSLMCLAQEDMKKLIAYSSVAHLGFCVLGMFAFSEKALQGAVLQMINHGISTGALFLCVGVLYERRHTRLLEDFGGIARVVPAFSAVLIIVTLSSIGLPGTNGFVGEFLILLGAFETQPLAAILATSGVVLGAVYMLWMVQRVLFGKIVHEENEALGDLRGREWATLLPLLVLIFFIGLAPNVLLSRMEPTLTKLVQDVRDSARVSAPPSEEER
ncbi:MAG: NADH-quinone oxidoreductase subunit M [Candidatus Brocadiae bacterium]|nr:NADH-quinone oxidoreductase subunit M [Candidatus Brocadiia bacterium]